MQVLKVTFSILNESLLQRIRFAIVSSALICDTQECDTEPDILCCTNNLFGNQVRIVVRLPIRSVMQIMKLSYGSDPRQRHLEKCHSGRDVDVLYFESIRCA